MRPPAFAAATAALFAAAATVILARGTADQAFPNAAGELRTIATTGTIDRSGPFFMPLGKQFETTCEHCHFASDGWSVSLEHVRQLFNSTDGKHPVFSAPSANDLHAALALSPTASLADRQAAYSELLERGVFLVRRNFDPASADFTIVAVSDPSLPASLATTAIDDDGKEVRIGTAGSVRAIPGAAYLQYTAQDNGGAPQIWVHRRPLPTTNFTFLTQVGWDGQDTRQSPNPVTRPTRDAVVDVAKATIRGRETGASLVAPDGHALTDAEMTSLATRMTDFMFSTFAAQETLKGGLKLGDQGGTGGVDSLSKQPFHFGINSTLQGDLTVSSTGAVTVLKEPFNPLVFTLFDRWHNAPDETQASIERGQALFNAMRLDVGGVRGLTNAQMLLPDGTTVPGPPVAVRGSCSACHNTPNVGNHSTREMLDIGISDRDPASAGLPIFVIKRKSDGVVVQTTDPGRAIHTGHFADIGEFKVPSLRGLAARAPFFHNGTAATLEDVVGFYNFRFAAGFTPREKADLVAFLKAL